MSHVSHDGRAMLDVCGCGRLHLTYGAITLNFRRDEFLRFAHDVERLASYLATFQGTACAPSQTVTRCH